MSLKMKPCRAGKRHLMTIEKPKTTQDATGHIDLSVDSNWTTAGSRRVMFNTRGGAEGSVLDQTMAEHTHIIEMNSDSFTRSILPAWRGRIGTRRFNFLSAIDVDEERHTVRIEAREPK